MQAVTSKTETWPEWLRSTRQPVVLALGGYWQDPTHSGLEAIRGALRGLDARLVVANSKGSFCVAADDDLAVPSLDRPGFEALYRTLGVDPGDLVGEYLTLTLVDQAFVRAQSHCEAEVSATDTLQQLLGWARRGILEAEDETARSPSACALSRHESVLLMLTGALTLPFVEACRPSSAPPASQPPPNSTGPAAHFPATLRSPLAFPWN